MRIVVDIGHPSQVHFFKNFISEMRKKGHQVLITVSEKDIATALLQAFGFEYTNLGTYGKSLLEKILNVPLMNIKMYRAVKDIKPDIFLGFGSVRAAHVAWFLRKPCVIFDGDDFTFPYYKWFVNTICVFSGFEIKGRKIVHVPGYKELAYLHPQWFSPSLITQAKEPITVLRFVARAFHDVGKKGFDLDFKRRLVRELEKYSTVCISSETSLPVELERYRVKMKPEEMHALLSGANLLVTDSGTMTTEAAVMGLPVVRCNSFLGQGNLGIFQELEKKYGLIFNYRDPELALNKAIELAQIPDIRILWEQKRKCLLQDKIDVTSFMVWFVEHYPESIHSAQSFWTSGFETQAKKGVNDKCE
jgi:predicted glycosyltransferase